VQSWKHDGIKWIRVRFPGGKEKGEIKRWIVNLVTGSAYEWEPVHLLQFFGREESPFAPPVYKMRSKSLVSLQRLGRRVNSQITEA
jgi:hypothetical protein